MRIGMVTDLMTRSGDGANDLRVLLSPFADDEKRRSGVKLCQDVEDTWCEDGVGAVVKGQGHAVLICRTTPSCLLDVSCQQIGTDGIESNTCTYHAKQYLTEIADGIHPTPPLSRIGLHRRQRQNGLGGMRHGIRSFHPSCPCA